MAPVHTAFAETWPEAEIVNLLDDGLTIDRAKETDLSPGMIQRFVHFGQYGYRIGATGVLVTCSAFGLAIDKLAASVPVPVLKPNEAMFQAALASGKTIGMLATFVPSVSTMTDEFEEYVAQAGVKATLTTIVVKDAIDLALIWRACRCCRQTWGSAFSEGFDVMGPIKNAATDPHRPQPSAPLPVAQRPAGPAKQCRDPSRGQQAIGNWRARRSIGLLVGSNIGFKMVCVRHFRLLLWSQNARKPWSPAHIRRRT